LALPDLDEVMVAGSFTFEVDGQQIGRFKEVHGLRAQIEVEVLAEGGQNQFAHKLPGRLTWPNIVMTRGLIASDDLFNWLMRCSGEGFEGNDRKLERTTAAITLIDYHLIPVKRWFLEGAFPVRWEGPSLAAGSSSAALEELEIAHHGFRAG
jgi:phage tail-like protein